MLAVAEFRQGLRSNLTKSRRKNDGTDLQITGLRLLIEIDGMTLTDGHTDLTGIVLQVHTGRWIDIIGCRYGLGIIDVDGSRDGQPLIIRVHMMFGAVLGAKPTGSTGIRINITRTNIKLCCEIPSCSFQCKQICIGDHLYIGRPTGLYQFWCQDSERAVIGRKRLVQLGHDTTNGR